MDVAHPAWRLGLVLTKEPPDILKFCRIIIVCVSGVWPPQHPCGGQKMTPWGWFFSFYLPMALGGQSCVSDPSPHGTISLSRVTGSF